MPYRLTIESIEIEVDSPEEVLALTRAAKATNTAKHTGEPIVPAATGLVRPKLQKRSASKLPTTLEEVVAELTPHERGIVGCLEQRETALIADLMKATGLNGTQISGVWSNLRARFRRAGFDPDAVLVRTDEGFGRAKHSVFALGTMLREWLRAHDARRGVTRLEVRKV